MIFRWSNNDVELICECIVNYRTFDDRQHICDVCMLEYRVLRFYCFIDHHGESEQICSSEAVDADIVVEVTIGVRPKPVHCEIGNPVYAAGVQLHTASSGECGAVQPVGTDAEEGRLQQSRAHVIRVEICQCGTIRANGQNIWW